MDQQTIRNIAAKASEAFDATHEIIRTLYGGFGVVGFKHVPDPCVVVRQMENELNEAGIRGCCDISHWDGAQISEELGNEIVKLIIEIFSNLRKHASSNSEYMFALSCDGTQISIVEMNEINRRRTRYSGLMGLRIHRQLIEEIGGSLEGRIEDNTWCLVVRIPLI